MRRSQSHFQSHFLRFASAFSFVVVHMRTINKDRVFRGFEAMRHLVRQLVPLLIGFAILFSTIRAWSAPAVQAARAGDLLTVSNESIAASWSIHGGELRWQSLVNHFTGVTLPLNGSPFELVPKEGPVLRSSDFKIVGEPAIENISDASASSRAADHVPGRQIRVELEDSSAKLHITWRAILREGANYVRQEVTIPPPRSPGAGRRSV